MLRRDASIEAARPVTRVEEVWAIADLPFWIGPMSAADLASTAAHPPAAKTTEAIVRRIEYTTIRLCFFPLQLAYGRNGENRDGT
jgi:hypothetical protein